MEASLLFMDLGNWRDADAAGRQDRCCEIQLLIYKAS